MEPSVKDLDSTNEHFRLEDFDDEPDSTPSAGIVIEDDDGEPD